MPESQPGFISTQNEFSAYIRDPEHNPAPKDVDKQRMAMYRELFFNNINTFISSNFPVLKKILDEQKWLALVQDFFNRHACKTPYFSEIPEEFLNYLQYEREGKEQDPPFLLELAHYEWVEMVLSIAKDEALVPVRILTDKLLSSRIKLGPLVFALAYHFPVHKISPEYQPKQPSEQQSFLIAYRTADYEVRFLEITPGTYRLLQLIQENESLPAKDYLQQVADEMEHPNPEVVLKGGLQILEDLLKKGIITVV